MSEELQSDESLSPVIEEAADAVEQHRAAFTIVVQSWATPILGILMLAIGLLAGYFGRPMIEGERIPNVNGENLSTGAAAIPSPDADLAAQQQALMEAVVGATRHFKGNPDAPVTIIEFSDFQ